MKRTIKTALLSFVLVAMAGANAYATEFITGKLSFVDPAAMPTTLLFVMTDGGNATCPTGTALRWSKPDPENMKAVYALLLTALAGDKQIRFYFDDGDTSCTGTFIHILN